MDTADLIKELWSIANIVTGFAVMQGLGFCLALGGNLGHLQDQNSCVKITLSVVCLLFAALYSFVVWECSNLAVGECFPSTPDNADQVKIIWCSATEGRIAAIFLFTALSPIPAIFAKNLFKGCLLGK